MNRNTIAVSYIFRAGSLFFAIIIFILSSIPNPRIPFEFHLGDKFLHLLEYMLFSLLLFFSFYTSARAFWQKNAYPFTLLIGAAYGLLDEFHQGFVPGRQRDFFDFLADLAGVVISLLIAWLLLKAANSKKITL